MDRRFAEKPVKTDEAKERWRKILREAFPGSIRVMIGEYGFTVIMPHPGEDVFRYTVNCRYKLVPENPRDRWSFFEWVRGFGEGLGRLEVHRFDDIDIHTLKVQ